MPSRKYARKSKRTFKRKPRGQRRFKRKRFVKNTRNMGRISGPTVPKNMRVKLTYIKEWRANVDSQTGTGLWSTVVHPSTPARTYPVDGQPSSIVFIGSQFCTPVGASGGTVVEDYPSGLTDWSSFYEEAICFGSSISIQMVQSQSSVQSTTNSIRYLLMALPMTTNLMKTQPNTAVSQKALLDATSYSDLMAYPGVRSGFLRTPAAGPTYVKSFRKTKTMLGIKDVRDNQTPLAMTLPTAADTNSGSNFVGDNTELGWFWYFRLMPFTTSETDNTSIQFVVKLKYYAQLNERKLILQANTTSV